MKVTDKIFREVKEGVDSAKIKFETEEFGTVREVKDGVVILDGLESISFGELITFESGPDGYVIDLLKEEVGAIILGDYLTIKSGEQAKPTGRTLSVPVNEQILGKVVNSLGQPVDGTSPIETDIYYPLEKIAPNVIQRRPVNVSLQTGVKSIDALIPIGRGQRELILGDRGTGKTTITIDAIINQKNQDVICIYCAIGQKNSKIAQVVDVFKKHQAMEYTIVVAAAAADPPAMQYLAPYTACAIGEYFMDKGKDVLVVYDDLTKHAWAYRQLSLVMRRPAGREAYPGDIFYLHSRLLERACRRDEKYGGGSLTAIPIIETLEGDVSGYIPTNVISICDGQIFLELDLFNAGVRPAINVGISVSRVGGTAQPKVMRQIAGKLKLDLAQYREMAAFSQFEAELDEETRKFLNRGAKVTQVLIQKKNKPYSLAEEVAIVWAATKGFLDQIPTADISNFEAKFLDDLRIRGKNLLEKINKKKVLDSEIEKELEIFVKNNLNEGGTNL